MYDATNKNYTAGFPVFNSNNASREVVIYEISDQARQSDSELFDETIRLKGSQAPNVTKKKKICLLHFTHESHKNLYFVTWNC